MKVAFDIGGLISRYPEQFKQLMASLISGGIEVHVLTDMNPEDAWNACVENGLNLLIDQKFVHSADWSKHGDLCKSKAMEELGIDILIDDRPDYCASGNFIGLVLSPRPEIDYYHSSWKNKSTPAVMVPPEELEEFLAWKQKRPH